MNIEEPNMSDIDPTEEDLQRYWDTVKALHQPGLDQLAYEAYVADAGGVSLATGAPLPGWADLPEAIQRAWSAVAVAVVERMFSRLRPAMVAGGQELAESSAELREACTIPATGDWDPCLPTEREAYQQRQAAAMALLDAVAALDGVGGNDKT